MCWVGLHTVTILAYIKSNISAPTTYMLGIGWKWNPCVGRLKSAYAFCSDQSGIFESWGIKQMKASSEVPAWFEQVCKLVWIITLCTWLKVPFHMVLIMLYTVQSFYKFILLKCTTQCQTQLCQTVCNLCTPISLLQPPLNVASPFLRLHQHCTNAMFPLGFLDIL